MEKGTFEVKVGLAEMLKGGVIMDVTTPEQAKIAEDSGAAAVMALEKIPADIRKSGGIARMANPEIIKKIQESVSIPVMAKCRIGHFAETYVGASKRWHGMLVHPLRTNISRGSRRLCLRRRGKIRYEKRLFQPVNGNLFELQARR